MKKSSLEIATSIVRMLVEAGYIAYFAGGWVRDNLLGNFSHEIDIATSAPPEIIMGIFPKTVAVGISFGVVIVIEEGVQAEVSTFRKDKEYKDGRHPEQIIFSSPEEDAKRRDFTINGIFYDPLNHTVLDYVRGQEDLKKKIIRSIGDPDLRFAEDRLRMIRAVRFKARFGFQIEKKTEKAILANAKYLFPAVSIERVFQEFCKMASYGNMDIALIELHRLGLLQVIFPPLKRTTLADIEKKVAPFTHFPKECPTIIFLVSLFRDSSLNDHLALCHYLKTSTQEARLTEFFYRSRELFSRKQGLELADWARFYAEKNSFLFLAIQKAYLPPTKRERFESEHTLRREKLKKHIERIINRKPLITASFLQKKGILPGRQMGFLLKEAERIAINYDINDEEENFRFLINRP